MLSCALPALSLAVTVVVCFSVRSFAEQQFLCSSNSLSVWWEYEGAVVFTRLELPRCSLGENKFVLSYMAMPLFTVVQVGWHMRVLYKNDTWLNLSQPLGSCEDFRICDIIKGETIRETFLIQVEPLYFTPDGEYQLILTVNIIEGLDGELTLRAKLTLHARNSSFQFTSYM